MLVFGTFLITTLFCSCFVFKIKSCWIFVLHILCFCFFLFHVVDFELNMPLFLSWFINPIDLVFFVPIII
jgi:hypothetical protein